VVDLVDEWVPRVYRFALRLSGDPHVADDLTQETFARAWRSKGRLRDPSAARVWLFRIAHNLWRDRLRRGRSPVERAGPADEAVLPLHPALDDQVAARDELERALAALDTLPPRQRDVLYLIAVEGLNAAEVAAVLGITADAAKATLSLARKKMRDLFSRDPSLRGER